MTTVRSNPCTACPYRQDVPSGVWRHDEYEKLRPYDNETHAQPPAAFRCHASPDSYCHGWAVTHTNRGHEHDLLALRLQPPLGGIPIPQIPLFSSGNAAADHGQRDIENPSPIAIELAKRIVRKHSWIES